MTSLEGWRSTIELRPRGLVVGGGFEPPKAVPSDLQSDPFGHSGNPPRALFGPLCWQRAITHAGRHSEPAVRIELTTPRLQGGSSTFELRWQENLNFTQKMGKVNKKIG